MWATSVTKHIEKKGKVAIHLDQHVANMRRYFVRQRQEIPELEKKLAGLHERAGHMTQRHQRRMVMDLRVEAQQVQEEIETIVRRISERYLGSIFY